VSGRSGTPPLVERRYDTSPDACERAIKSLLQRQVRKNPAADPSSRGDSEGNTTKEDSPMEEVYPAPPSPTRPERRGVSRKTVIDEAKEKVPVIDLADLLCGLCCHNICVVCQSTNELGIEPDFCADSQVAQKLPI
jgi:hypothetical protein